MRICVAAEDKKIPIGKSRAPMEIPDNVIPSAKLRRCLKYTPMMADEGVNRNPAPKPTPSP